MSATQALREKRVLRGFWCVTGSSSVIEAAASVGPDFVVVDTQHGTDLGNVDASVFTVVASYEVASLVRVESNEPGRIGRALDLGADGIIVPLIDTAEDAARAVAATRHAPKGSRSYGMQTRRLGPFDQRPFVVIQVETAAAVDNLDAIAATEGVDALYIGPADLGLSLGGEPAPDVEEVFDGTHANASILADAFNSVVETSRAHGVFAGLHCGSGASSARAIEQGFAMTSLASDLGLVTSGLQEQLTIARGASS